MNEAPTPPLVPANDPPPIPNKLYFKIGEVSQLVGVEAYVLRYWESEFPALAPRKSDTGQRMFRRKDVELLLRIKHLLYDQKFTIEGARKALQAAPKEAGLPRHGRSAQRELFSKSDPIPEIRRQLIEIIRMLS
jgi:DNA-binding transcriptional MerR regulator